MELDRDLLAEALYNLVEIKGETKQAITSASGVHNIGRFISKTITPMPESWWKLHKAYPNDVPEPSYKDGSPVYANISNQADTVNQASGDINIGGVNLTTQQKYFIELLNEHDLDGKYLQKITLELLQSINNSNNS